MPLIEWVAATLFVLSSGILFNRRFRRNRLLVGVTGVIAIVATVSLLNAWWKGRDRGAPTVRIQSIRFLGSKGGLGTISDESYQPKDTLFKFQSDGPSQNGHWLPINVAVVLRNHSNRTIVIERESGSRLAPELEIGWATDGDRTSGKTVMRCWATTRLSVSAWSDGNSPVLVLRKGDVKWITFAGSLDGYEDAWQLDMFNVRAVLDLEGVGRIGSPWLLMGIDGGSGGPHPPCIRG